MDVQEDIQEKDADAKPQAEGPVANEEVDKAEAIVRKVKEQLSISEVREACAIIRSALDADGGVRSVDLLLVMADVEFADSELLAGKDRLEEAVDASHRKPEAVAGQISALRRNHLWRDALEAVKKAEKIPDEIRDTAVRAAVGDFYRDCRCHAHASKNYTWRHGLRHASWLLSGGPFAPIRTRVDKWETERLLHDLERSPAYIDQIDSVGLGKLQKEERHLQLETLDYRLLTHLYWWRALVHLGYRLMPAVILPVWLALVVVVHQARFASGWGTSAGAAALSVFIAAPPVALLVVVLFRSKLRLRAFVVSSCLAVALVAAAGEGFDSGVLPVGGWWSWVLLGVVAILAAVACLMIAVMAVNWLWRRWSRKLIREDCPLFLLYLLLDVLDYLRPATGSRNIDRRLRLAGELEYAARCLTRDLLPSATTSFLGSRDWLAESAEGWAEAWRQMQRQILASVPGDLAKLEELLVHDIRCLATCDMGALAWREPPPAPSRRKQVIAWVQVLVVALLPLALVLIIQQFARVPGVFGWVTAGWAVVCVVFKLDPTIRDKLEAAQEIAALLRR